MPLINVMCICSRNPIFLITIDTFLKDKSIPEIAKVFEREIACVGGPKGVTIIVIDNASNYKGVSL